MLEVVRIQRLPENPIKCVWTVKLTSRRNQQLSDDDNSLLYSSIIKKVGISESIDVIVNVEACKGLFKPSHVNLSGSHLANKCLAVANEQSVLSAPPQGAPQYYPLAHGDDKIDYVCTALIAFIPIENSILDLSCDCFATLPSFPSSPRDKATRKPQDPFQSLA